MPIRPLTKETIDRYVAAGVWREEPFHRTIERLAETNPDKPAMRVGTTEISFSELITAARGLAGWLLETGVEPEDCVALQAPNHVALPIAHLACGIADLRLVPLAHAFRGQEVGHLLNVSRARIVIVPPADAHDYRGVVEELRSGLPELRLVGQLTGGGADFALDEVWNGPPPSKVNDDPNRATFCMITSGTTGASRVSLFSDNDLGGMLWPFAERTRLHADDRAVGIAPANTGSTGYIFPILTTMLVGATATLIDHWSPATALDLLESERATKACAIPTQIVKMLQEPDVRERDYSELRAFSNAGAPLAPEMADELEEVFGCRVQTIYGATDGGVPAMTDVDDPKEKRRATVGRLLPETDLRLVDAELQDVGVGEPGEILWRNGTKSYAYLNNDERSEAAFTEDGYYLSGDLGAIDEDGYLRIVGRVKDMILRGGQNISPREVEEILLGVDSVAEISIVGVPDPVYGERACACVVPRPGGDVTLDLLTGFLADRSVERYKFPEFVELFDAFPTNQGAKISKVELRRLVLERWS